MDRRKFLSLFALGAPAAVVAEKLGLLERMRSYFFAPRGGWVKQGELYVPSLEGIPYFAENYTTGEWMGLARFPFSCVLKTPTITARISR